MCSCNDDPELDDDLKELQEKVTNVCAAHLKIAMEKLAKNSMTEFKTHLNLAIKKLGAISAGPYNISGRIEENICMTVFALEDLRDRPDGDNAQDCVIKDLTNDITGIPINIQYARENT
ncbi:MAG: hypothetical protein ACXAC5_04555 [Promethearchaeota archaeon]|jgi:hypothetical protein